MARGAQRKRIPAWRRYLRFWGPDVDADVDDELRFHLEMLARDFESRGMPAAEAWRAARARFGDVSHIERALRTHDRRRERQRQRREHMGDLLQDLRYGVRGLRRTPGFTIVSVLTLALGIGATTAIFSVVNGVILRPLPYPGAERIVMIWMDNRRMQMNEDLHSWPNLQDFKAQNRTFERVGTYVYAGYNLTGGCAENACEPVRIAAAAGTADLFPVLGVRPQLGRTFTPEEEEQGRDAVVVVSHGLWTRQFGGDAGVVGRTVRMNGRERTVIGVMPRGFAFPARETDAWVPLVVPQDSRGFRNSFGYWAVGRLKPGVTFASAERDAKAVADRLEAEYPGNRDFGLHLVALPDQIVGRSMRTALWVMLGAVAAVLLIACANVANLTLSRTAVREREVGVRVALGASRGRLVRQLLTESVLLALVGAAFGVALALVGLRALMALAPADTPRLGDVRIDPLVLGVTLGVAVFTGLAFGLVPALESSRPDLSDTLRDGARGGTSGRRAHRVRRGLTAAQVALVVVLLTAAGLLLRSFQRLQDVQLGFRPDHLLTMQISLPFAKYQQPAQRIAFYDALTERVRALPGVQGVGAISSIFLSKTPNSTIFTIEGKEATQEQQNVEVPLDAVTPDYFRVMGIALLRGRAFTAQDAADSTAQQVVIINESMASKWWPGEDVIGKRFRYGGASDGDGNNPPWMTIVGVVGDMRRTGLDAPVRYETFLPHTQLPRASMTLVVRTVADPVSFVPAVRGAVRSLDPDQPVYEIASMDDLLSGMVAQRRFSMALLGTFAGLALLLGLVGVYGVTAYLVAQRTREIGLRLALGAEPAQLVGMVVRQGMMVAGIGVALGLAGAFALTRVMASLLYGISTTDAVTFVAVPVVLVAATLVANWLPARRAARVDPMVALRYD